MTRSPTTDRVGPWKSCNWNHRGRLARLECCLFGKCRENFARRPRLTVIGSNFEIECGKQLNTAAVPSSSIFLKRKTNAYLDIKSRQRSSKQSYHYFCTKHTGASMDHVTVVCAGEREEIIRSSRPRWPTFLDAAAHCCFHNMDHSIIPIRSVWAIPVRSALAHSVATIVSLVLYIDSSVEYYILIVLCVVLYIDSVQYYILIVCSTKYW